MEGILRWLEYAPSPALGKLNKIVLRFLTLPLLSNRTLLIGLSPKYLGFIFLPWFCPPQQLLRLILK